MSIYGYCKNNPLKYIDPNGLEDKNVSDKILKNIDKLAEYKDELNKIMLEASKRTIKAIKNNYENISDVTYDDIYEKINNIFKKVGIPEIDGLVLSNLTVSGTSQYAVGLSGEFELIHTKDYGSTLFGIIGANVSNPGGSATLTYGFIWGLNGDPSNYTGRFITNSYQIGYFGFNISTFPNAPTSFTFGLATGTSPFSGAISHYERLWDSQLGWIPDIKERMAEHERTKYDFFQQINKFLNNPSFFSHHRDKYGWR